MTRNRVPATAADALVAVLLAAAGAAVTGVIARRTGTPVDGWAYALVVAAALPLAGRRVWPLPVLALTTVAASTYLVLGNPYGPILLSLLLAVYTVARHLPPRPAAAGAATALVVVLLHASPANPDGPGSAGILPGSAWVVVPFAIGVTRRLSREAADRAQADLVRRHADEERLRVAQEVHDVVGHGLAAIQMRAEIALHLLDRRPQEAYDALTAISRTSREALDELRSTLALVRQGGPAEDTRAPTAGLARLDDLVTRMSATGVAVRVEADGARRDLPPAVDLAMYRVVQESLTNVLRHAGSAATTVRLRYRPDTITVEVTDAGPGGLVPADTGGHGLTGMRERVTGLRGAFEAGPADGGGFRVYASVPLSPVEPGGTG